jgi:hypothetical protein
MSASTSTKTTKKVVAVSQPESEPMFSEEFLRVIQDLAYETLRAHLEKTKQKDAIELLDDLIVLSIRPYQKRNLSIYNRCMSETIGLVSHHVLILGGNFGK